MICGDYYMLDNEICTAKEFKDPFNNGNLNIYEVVRIDDGIPLFFEDHLIRLENSFRIAGKKLFYSDTEIKDQVYKLIEINKIKEALIRIVFSFVDGNELGITVFQNRVTFPGPEDYKYGISCLLQYSERDNPSAKIFNHEVRGKANSMINTRQVYETILVNSKNKITEGSRSNVFFIKNEVIYTTQDDKVLQGITRQKVIEIIISLNIPLHYTSVDIESIAEMDAVFITGTTPKVLAVNKIDEIKFKANNSLIEQIMQVYDDMVEDYKKVNSRSPQV